MPGLKWGDGAKWGDGTLYGANVPSGGGGSGAAIQTGFTGLYFVTPTTELEYQSGLVLQSPDGTSWTWSISTAGLITISSGTDTPTSPVPVFRGGEVDIAWTPSISNAGIVTLTRGTYAGEKYVALVDSDNISWEAIVSAGQITSIQTLTRPAKRMRIAVSIKHSGSEFVVHRVHLEASLTTQHSITGYYAFSGTGTIVGEPLMRQIAVSVKHSGSDFVIWSVRLDANTKRRLLAG